ncbi:MULTISPECIES: bifunctional dTDP-4-dehydrorhamnose 3,5-epimerase family protein/NAD(P)-dependent oxidoreductase [Arthrobacter]|uniref:dTDP-4-dehydrorhamnose reductase n=2 Tax=Arthrobacter TaxID=1663 RepID=A0ABU9KLF5_9MICC|nr:bifunctional dTDP-4-dehydrorhamnose 3,5-epimerase family protein/NAD(P)-dependent oxidoreductase [Arthrobacter sp. YJM1]MDP5227741.1 bifunctional dTDP-4-dehydrorhamnose 3,5-epimerase family protein/NAD(P)-dependent oxidoreductase [Arthrobacter sp. YJM1]
MEFSKTLGARRTAIPGLLVLDLPVHGDNRGWFKENWQREKMLALGLPDFGPVQNNISFNEDRGTTRGIHAEPWDKYVSVATGEIFGAWVDLRRGPTFGTVHTERLDPSRAVFVPRGVGNAFQTLQDGTAYTYLVNEHWSPDAEYTFLNLADPTAAIRWPVPLAEAELSAKDRAHPLLDGVTPMDASPGRVLVLGGNGQLGRALRAEYADHDDVDVLTRQDCELSDPAAVAALPFGRYRTVINAAAYTAVDAAETPEGRRLAWAVNSRAVAQLAAAAVAHGFTLVHVSTDYVYDGARSPHTEDEPPSPLGVYGQSKAAGDAAVAVVPRHYLIRTSWVVGDGGNFVDTMASLAARGAAPSVVADQTGRVSFARDIARGIRHLVDTGAPYGTYNLSNTGPVQSWADVARDVFRLTGADPSAVRDTSTAEYFAGRDAAPRPAASALDLSRLQATGFIPRTAAEALEEHLERRGLERAE